MGKMMETVQEVNRAVRNVALVGLTGVLGTAGFVTYNKFTKDERMLLESQREVAKLTSLVQEQEAKLAHLSTSIRLLKVDQRLATIEILNQKPDSLTGKTLTTLRFTEVNPEGVPLSDPREFNVIGSTVYIDNWVVKFEDKYVEEADIIRGTSLTLFRRVFGDDERPNEGYALDEVGSRPGAYARGGQASDFEKEIWSDFWSFANDPLKAKDKGIRAAHGEAVSIKAEVGKTYRIVLRASDGLSIIPQETPAPNKPNAT
jgi:hypothetical protein